MEAVRWTTEGIGELTDGTVEALQTVVDTAKEFPDRGFILTEELGNKILNTYESIVGKFAEPVKVGSFGAAIAVVLDNKLDITKLYSSNISSYQLAPEITLNKTLTLKAILNDGNKPHFLVNNESPILYTDYSIGDGKTVTISYNMNNPTTNGDVFWTPYVITSTNEQGYALWYKVTGGYKYYAKAVLNDKVVETVVSPGTDDKLENGLAGTGTVTIPVPDNGLQDLVSGADGMVKNPAMTDSSGNVINGSTTDVISPADSFLDKLIERLKALGEKLMEALELMLGTILKPFELLLEGIKTLLGNVLNTITDIITSITDDISNRLDKLKDFNIPRLDLFLLYIILIIYRMIMFALEFFQFLFGLLTPSLYSVRAEVLPPIVIQSVEFFHNLEIPQLGFTVMELFNTTLTICIGAKVFKIIRGRVSMEEGAYDIALAKQEQEQFRQEQKIIAEQTRLMDKIVAIDNERLFYMDKKVFSNDKEQLANLNKVNSLLNKRRVLSEEFIAKYGKESEKLLNGYIDYRSNKKDSGESYSYEDYLDSLGTEEDDI